MRALLVVGLMLATATDDKEELNAITKDLASKTEKTRLAAVKKAEALGPKAEPILKSVCDRLVDTSPKVGLAALVAIEKIDPDLYKPLSDWLLSRKDDDASINRAFAELTKLGERAKLLSTVMATRLKFGLTQEFRYEVKPLFDAAIT